MQKRIVTYQEFGKLLDLLVAKLEAYKFDYVYGPPRGGLPIAVHLSHHLDIELVGTDFINWSIYHGSQKILLADDVVDTGQIINGLKSLLGKSNIITAACLFKRTKINDVVHVEESDDWIIFPFEKYDEKPSEYHQEIYPELFGEKDEV